MPAALRQAVAALAAVMEPYDAQVAVIDGRIKGGPEAVVHVQWAGDVGFEFVQADSAAFGHGFEDVHGGQYDKVQGQGG